MRLCSSSRVSGLTAISTFVVLLFAGTSSVHGQTRAVEQQSDFVRPIGAQQSDLDRRIDLDLTNVPLIRVLNEIAAKTGVKVIYANRVIQDAPMVTIQATGIRVRDALERVLRGTNITLAMVEGQPALVEKAQTAEQKEGTGLITGKVIDSASKKGIPGVTVAVVGTKLSAVTQPTGVFLISKVPPGTYTVSARLVGYASKTAMATVNSEKPASVSFVLHQTSTMLSEVVTTATGMQRKVEVGNDIVTLDVEEIIQNNPVSTLTDLLSTRVPGLIVGRMSGEPGAKTDIRMRGTNSLRASNQPIVIVDGIQVISDRTGFDTTGFATSLIDQFDLNTISKVEVLRGPSAVALYGSNASNGVFIITTKRGQEGPARWNTVAKLSLETMPGKWPLNYFAWGEDLVGGQGTIQCSRLANGDYNTGVVSGTPNWGAFPNCRYDSTTVYQVLNHPNTTVFGTGVGKEFSTTVSGGVRRFTYSFTGGFLSTLGLLKVPDADVALLNNAGIHLEPWQRRPQALERYTGTGTIVIGVGDNSTVEYTTMVTRQDKRSTPLIGILNSSRSLDPPLPLYDQDGERIGVGSGVLIKEPNLLAGQNFLELRFTNSARYKTTLWNTITFETNGGIDVTSGRETYLRKTGDFCPLRGPLNVAFGNCTAADENELDYRSYRNSAIATDVHVRVSGTPRGFPWLNVTPIAGIDMNGTTYGQSGIGAKGLPVGGRGIRGAEAVEIIADAQGARRTAGMFAQATLKIADRVFLPFAVRTDAGNAIGQQAKPIFPRVALSYLVSDEPRFRMVPMFGRLPELRIRTAFGVAGQQPGLADKHRTFIFSQFPIDNVNTSIANIYSVGNSKLSPEISRELELGFDATVLETPRSRLAGTFTLARKHTTDLLAVETLPPSLGGAASGITFGELGADGASRRISNIGDAMNNTIEVTLEGFQRFGSFDWTTTNGFATQKGKLTRMRNSLDRGWASTNTLGKIDPQTRYRVGYPLNSVWLFPVLGAVDADGNGLIDLTEVAYDDSLRYAGTPSPRFTLASSNQITIMSRLTMSAVLTYEDGGVTTVNRDRSNYHSRVMNDPTISMENQVRLLYDASARAYRVSTLRFQSVQITYNVPVKFAARYFRTRSVQVAVSGTNLGLWSTFSGMDPNVGGISRNQLSLQLPIPRTYGLSVRVQ